MLQTGMQDNNVTIWTLDGGQLGTLGEPDTPLHCAYP
jgi:hypothetical protein